MPTTTTCPTGLRDGGATLWREVTEAHTLDVVQLVLLEEACRIKDRLDRLATDDWPAAGPYRLVVSDPDRLANKCAEQLKYLLAALRLPDHRGIRPQRRGGARGAYRPVAVARRKDKS